MLCCVFLLQGIIVVVFVVVVVIGAWGRGGECSLGTRLKTTSLRSVSLLH